MMLCIARLCCHKLSVCLSVCLSQSSIVSKWLNVSSMAFHPPSFSALTLLVGSSDL